MKEKATNMKSKRRWMYTGIGFFLFAGWLSAEDQAFVGARIIDGSGKAAVGKATLIVRNGRIDAVGPTVKVPSGMKSVDATGKTIIPGLINAHAHVSDITQLDRYARFGVTTVF